MNAAKSLLDKLQNEDAQSDTDLPMAFGKNISKPIEPAVEVKTNVVNL